MKLLRFILYPLVPIYAFIISIRNWLFEKGIFKSVTVNAKVISVGNITMGGSGKTPLVIYLTKLIKNEKNNVGVLSRGYGRKSKGYFLISDGKKMLVDVTKSGDEIFHTAIECSVPAAVCESRVEGAKRLIEETKVDTLVLDDAFQHRWINRNIDLLICEQQFLNDPGFFSQRLLPTGNMRENYRSVSRADAIIINKKFSDTLPLSEAIIKYGKDKNLFYSYYEIIGFVDAVKGTEYNLKDFEGQKSLIVSGIANPYSFINALKKTKVDTSNQIIFPDHKNYTLKEIQKIRSEFYKTNSHSVITTQKDSVKLSKYSDAFDDVEIFYLKIKLKLEDESGFKNFIFSKIN